MPRKKKGVPIARSRPVIPIDWNVVDRLLEAGCCGSEIAANIGCSGDTLYDRCVQEKGVIFSEYLREKRQNGDALLRSVQFRAAMKGDRTMMVWLGKQRLSQRESQGGEAALIHFNIQIQEVPK